MVCELPSLSNSALLQDAQEFGLQFARDVIYFIEKQRSFIGQFDASDIARDGAGKRSAFVAKQFAFQQSCGNECAIRAHQRLITACGKYPCGK
jgi:hypothetical protein